MVMWKRVGEANLMARTFAGLTSEEDLDASVAPEAYYRFIYPSRILGMALAGLSAGAGLYVAHAPPWAWVFLCLTAFVWPHIAYLNSKKSQDPVASEWRNLMLDSAFIGVWLPLMDYNLLPSVVIAMITTLDKGFTLYRRLWLYSLIGLLGVAAGVGLLLTPVPRLDSSLLVVLSTLPLLFAYTWFNTYRGTQLLRIVTRQNWVLAQQHRTDAQSGLYARTHWLERADKVFREDIADGFPPYLLLIDIDHFKTINDSYGHIIGDEVICEVGKIVRECVRKDDIAGRFGGDEFTVIVPQTRHREAFEIALRILYGIEQMCLSGEPDLRLSVSIGLAARVPEQSDLRDWLDHADAALYRAKHSGRNRVETFPSSYKT